MGTAVFPCFSLIMLHCSITQPRSASLLLSASSFLLNIAFATDSIWFSCYFYPCAIPNAQIMSFKIVHLMPEIILQTHAFFQIGRGEQPPIPDFLSPDARDFISQCVKVNPDDRPSASQLLQHPFMNRSLWASSSSDSSSRGCWYGVSCIRRIVAYFIKLVQLWILSLLLFFTIRPSRYFYFSV